MYEHGFDYTKALLVLLLAPEFFLPLRQMGLTYHARMRALGAMSGLMDLLHERDVFPAVDLQAAPATAASSARAEGSAGNDSAVSTASAESAVSTARARLRLPQHGCRGRLPLSCVT